MYENRFFKILCLVLVLLGLFSAFALPSFASGSNLISDNMGSWDTVLNTYSSNPTIAYSNPLNSIVLQSNSQANQLLIKSNSVSTENISAGHTYKLSFEVKGNFTKCNLLAFVCLNGNWGSPNGQGVTQLGTVYDNFTDFTTFSTSFVPSDLYSSVSTLSVGLELLQQTSGSATLYIRNISLVDSDDEDGFWSDLWDWLGQIRDRLISGFSALSGKLTQIFNNLGDWFDDVGQWFSDLASDIGQFFVDLGDNISEFFDTLRDYLLYFQHPVELDENGIPVDENGFPIYENIFDIPDFFETLDDWIDDLEQAKSDVESGASAGIQAFENTIVPFTSILNRVPVLTVLITFALAIIVIKKVIG